MARTTKAERKRRREAALAKISDGHGFADTVAFVMSEWGCSRLQKEIEERAGGLLDQRDELIQQRLWLQNELDNVGAG